MQFSSSAQLSHTAPAAAATFFMVSYTKCAFNSFLFPASPDPAHKESQQLFTCYNTLATASNSKISFSYWMGQVEKAGHFSPGSQIECHMYWHFRAGRHIESSSWDSFKIIYIILIVKQWNSFIKFPHEIFPMVHGLD